ncbi:PIN domain nuclease [Senegalimassilia anaerobia]|uniref:PIN domain nuclease n=2 Tax=Senegalimassilia anaerobia TaxID=1473216 RepID=A0A369LCP7_9ACTN|nr:PIN domain-containing protein [Senegalimassilia anaerobia]RDB55778.1 PIN domain nuclease [Senegalimassilia anaerobia]
MDFMNERQPFYQQTRMLMVAGRVGEFDLWVTAPQVVDLVYLLSEGGKPELLPRAMERIRGLRTFVQVADLTAANVDRMLASSGQNPEGQLMVNAAIDLRADFLLTHEPDGLENGLVKVTNVPGMFEWLCENRDLDYTQIEI